MDLLFEATCGKIHDVAAGAICCRLCINNKAAQLWLHRGFGRVHVVIDLRIWRMA